LKAAKEIEGIGPASEFEKEEDFDQFYRRIKPRFMPKIDIAKEMEVFVKKKVEERRTLKKRT